VKLSNLKIGQRLGAGFLVVVVALVLLTVVGVLRVDAIDDRLTVINELNSVKQRYAINFRGSVHDRAIAARDVVLARTTEEVQPEVATIEELATFYADSAVKMDEIFADPEKVNDKERAALADIKRVEQETLPLIQQVIDLRLAGDSSRALTVLVQEAKPRFVEWLRVINVFIDLEESMNQTETAEARSIAGGFLRTMMIVCALAIAVAVAVAWRITRSITRPIAQSVEVLSAVAGGDLTRRMDTTAKDELGQMGRSLNEALGTVGSVLGGFGQSIDRLASASIRLSSLSDRIADGARESSAQADVVAVAAGDVSHNVQTVAAGSEEMGASIREISTNAQGAASVADQAMAAMESTTATVSQLGESSRMIGDVVKVISSIAEQTNLLALNATIEAARAGEAGKGFAVVANEVKELSQETARATQDIAQRVETIQAATTDAVSAIGEVSRIITQVNDYQVTISSAVEEQTATTNEMNRNVAEAANGSVQIADSIGGVATVAKTTTESVTEAQDAVRELSGVSDELRGMVGRFRF
jgi:methyl-accepting chemotaxis protein